MSQASKWACIFDFDGVIADSIPGLYQIYLDFLRARGVQGSETEFARLNGPNLHEIASYLKTQYAWTESVNTLERLYLEALRDVYSKAALHLGASACLKRLVSNGVPLILASACNRKDIDAFLHRYGLATFFSTIVSGDDVAQAKPHPDIYLKARAEVPGHHCLVVEDGLNGLKAAQAAGLITVHYASNTDALFPASFHIKELMAIPLILKNLQTASGTYGAFPFTQDMQALPLQSPQLTITQSEYRWTEKDKRIVSDIWAGKPEYVFDDDVLCFSGQSHSQAGLAIEAKRVPYRYIYAQCQGAALSSRLYPLAVSGMIIDKQNHVLFALRDQVTQYAGYKELVPSGGLPANTSCPLEQLLIELEEETDIPQNALLETCYVGVFFDSAQGVFDCVFQLVVEDVCQYTAQNPSFKHQHSEYRHYAHVHLDQIGQSEHPWVPTSLAVLRYMSRA